MKTYIILYYAKPTDVRASQEEVEATNMHSALGIFHGLMGWNIEPMMCYPLGLRPMYQAQEIPSSLQKDIEHE